MGLPTTLSAEEVRRGLSVAEVATRRLREFRHSSLNVVTYEGTLLDRLLYHFVSATWPADAYEVICSVRPCMHPTLIAEVRRFASHRRYPLLGFDGDCSARHPWDNSPRACENVSMAIRDRLGHTNGVLLSSGLLNGSTKEGFEATNSESEPLYVFESAEVIRHRDPAGGRTWKTLFVLEGMEPADVVAAHVAFLRKPLASHHVPICYLDCYNEQELRKTILLLDDRER